MLGTVRPTGIMVLLVGGLLAFPTLAQAAGVQADFDGDGFDDLAVGVPHDNVGGISNAGAVNVIYGSGAGLTEVGDQLFHQDRPGIRGKGEFMDFFGWSVAAGDFDGDRYDDLAVGIRDEGVGGDNAAGAVQVIYGSAFGLTAVGDQLWHQDAPGILGVADVQDAFGTALTSGNFDGDAYDDLAVGAPKEDLSGQLKAGAVHAIYGSSAGLTATGDQLWHQASDGILDSAEDFDEFGWSLAAGDFDGDRIDDLAVGLRGEGLGGEDGAGAAHAIYGGFGPGLTEAGDQFWHQDSPGISGGAEEDDCFADALAAGDFDGDDLDDLAVGNPCEGLGGVEGTGVVHAIYGSEGGLATAASQLWHQDTSGIAGGTEKNDFFGDSLTAGDFNGFSDDLAVGVPLENLGDAADAGVVHAIYGSGGGLTSLGSQLWSEDLAAILDTASDDDVFGRALTVGDFNDDGADDLGAATPHENLDCPDFGCGGDLGAVHAIYSSDSAAGLSADGDQFWHRKTPGIVGKAGVGDAFGFALAR